MNIIAELACVTEAEDRLFVARIGACNRNHDRGDS